MKIIDYVKRKIENSELKSLYEVIITASVCITLLYIVSFLFAAIYITVERLI
tara:strand:+ start:378 stop:533 length:156 start_codon:yes stop_codon:yes gene_type:complete